MKYSTKTLFLAEEDKEMFNLFEKYLGTDNTFLKTIPLNKIKLLRKNGLTTEGIRWLVRKYIDFKCNLNKKISVSQNVSTTSKIIN